jgi:hypothetical protein
MATLKAARVNMNQSKAYQHGSCPNNRRPVNGNYFDSGR